MYSKSAAFSRNYDRYKRPIPEFLPELERLYVRRLPALGSLDYVELHCLALLKALESVRIDRRVMYEYILAVLTADEAKPLGIVKPLHCSLFHVRYFLIAIEFAARSKSGFVHTATAENQSVSNDD
jgi:hypothetical protein